MRRRRRWDEDFDCRRCQDTGEPRTSLEQFMRKEWVARFCDCSAGWEAWVVRDEDLDD